MSLSRSLIEILRPRKWTWIFLALLTLPPLAFAYIESVGGNIDYLCGRSRNPIWCNKDILPPFFYTYHEVTSHLYMVFIIVPALLTKSLQLTSAQYTATRANWEMALFFLFTFIIYYPVASVLSYCWTKEKRIFKLVAVSFLTLLVLLSLLPLIPSLLEWSTRDYRTSLWNNTLNACETLRESFCKDNPTGIWYPESAQPFHSNIKSCSQLLKYTYLGWHYRCLYSEWVRR